MGDGRVAHRRRGPTARPGAGGLEAVELDLRDGGSIRAAIDNVRPTILVNNAGVGTVGIKRNAAYCAGKGGVEALTKVLALEWGPRGITVNAVAPGFIRTTVNAEAIDRPEFVEEMIARFPVGRVGTTTDVAAAVLLLAAPAASFVNGTSVLLDGGWTAQ
jgi:NAD(P)-dependent dehydrogenase (short-subunit alcohol dehydrogenase family)